MQALAFGEVGLSYDDFWFKMTPREFSNAVEGYFNRRRDGWEQARMIATTIHNKPVQGYKIRPMSVERFMKLPWDNKVSEPVDRTEEIEKIKEYRKAIEQKNGK